MTIAFVLVSFMPFIRSGANALLINKLVDIIGGALVDNSVYVYAGVLLTTYIAGPLFFTLEMYYMKLFWYYLERKFQVMVLDKLGRLDIAIHEDPKYQDLINKVREGGMWSINQFTDRQFYLIQNTIEVLLASSILAYTQWWLFLILLLGTIPELVNELKYGRFAWTIYGSNSETRRKFFDLRYRFMFTNPVVELKLFQNAEHFTQLVKELIESFQKKEIKNEKVRIKYKLLAMLISQITFGIAVVYFIQQVVGGNLQIGSFTFMIASISALRTALSSLFGNLARQYQDNLYISDMFALFDIKEVVKKPKSGIDLKNIAPKIEFKNVSFKYPGTDTFILKNFSLVIEPGEKIAIVGINGAGKTTLIKLLCRFYDPTKGKILINGTDLKDLNIESWYSLMGVLFQDYERYHFLVKDVISLGRSSEKTNLKKVKQSAIDSESDVFINEWKKKYSQMLGKQFSKGVEPSVGQWQKIALARTFYRDPKLLILDEPTASIDAEAEAKIFDRIHKKSHNKTIILISHRFSTVRNADKICVIENGKKSEYGTHQELLKNKKTYFRLFKLQAKGYK